MSNTTEPLKQYHVWDRNVRFFHWINVVCVLGLITVGTVILNNKILGISTDGKILLKTIHVYIGYVFLFNLGWRFVWAFLGNQYSRWKSIIPFTKDHRASLKVYLEGAYNGTNMNTDLTSFFPINQPFSVLPWNYNGTEDVMPIPSGSIVDWGLIELRETIGNASTATGSTIVAQQAVLIRNDGKVKGLDGSNLPNFSQIINDNLFVVIHQRNHVSVMSANALSLIGSAYTYDFSTGVGQVYGGPLGYKEIGTGVWGMLSGDGNADGTIDINDKNDPWIIQAAEKGYRMGDFNLNGQVENSDKNENWLPNIGSGSQVPD